MDIKIKKTWIHSLCGRLTPVGQKLEVVKSSIDSQVPFADDLHIIPDFAAGINDVAWQDNRLNWMNNR